MTKPTFIAGDVPTAAQVNGWFVNTLYAVKTANESVTSNVTPQDDDHLTLSVEANASYLVQALFKFDGATAGDFRWKFVGPAGATYDGINSGLTNAAATTADDHAPYTPINTDNNHGALGAGTAVAASSTGLLIVAGTAGNFKVQWAQSFSSATATILQAGSFILLKRVA